MKRENGSGLERSQPQAQLDQKLPAPHRSRVEAGMLGERRGVCAVHDHGGHSMACPPRCDNGGARISAPVGGWP